MIAAALRAYGADSRALVVAGPLLALLGLVLALATVFRPLTVLIGVVAVSVLVVAALRAEVALLLLIAMAPLEGLISYGQEATLSPTKLVGILCFTSYFLNAFATRRRLWLDRTHAIVLVLLLVALVSSTIARDIPTALSVSLRYGSFVALYLVITQFVGDHRLQRRMVWTLSIACAVTGFFAVRNFLSGEELLALVPHADANDTAYILATTLPLTFWLLRGNRALWPLVFLLIGLISASVVLSLSRGAMLGLAAAAVWHAIANRKHIPVLIAGALVLVVSVAFFVRSNPEQVEQGLLAKQNVAEENVATRWEAWGAALQLAIEHPIGIGPGNFPAYYFDAANRPVGSESLEVVHSTYLEFAAELGITSILLFLAFLGIALSRLNESVRDERGPPGFAQAVRASLVVAVVGGLTLSEQYYAPFWVIGGLATVIWAEKRVAEEAAVADDDMTARSRSPLPQPA